MKDQLYLLVAAGIKKVIVCCNKMDHRDVGYGEASYKLAKFKITEVLNSCGFKNVPFIPTSSLYGENLAEKSDKMLWYEGPTFLQALQTIDPPKRLTEKPLRFCVQNVRNIGGTGTVLFGRV